MPQANAKTLKIRGKLPTVTVTLPLFEELQKYLLQHPDLNRWHHEIALRQAQVDLEKANAIPDLYLTGGMRHHHQSNDFGLVAGVSIALPLWNQNQGNIRMSEQQLFKSQQEQQTITICHFETL